MQEINQISIAIVGVVRNCENKITDDIKNLQNSTKSFQSVKWLLIESDSDDNTVSSLKLLKSKIANFNFISLGKLKDKLKKRTERIAYCRNKYVEEINNNLNYKDLDYVFVSDFDGTNKLINEEAILSCFLSPINWDACTANQKGPYYDIWALRHSILGPNDCYEEYSFYRSCGLSEERSKNLAIYSKMITISQSSDWIEVDSAFGGLGIYKKSLFVENEYRGLSCQGDEICEHVYFHRLLRSKGANIYINPRLINTDINEHSLQTTFRFKLFRIAWRIFTLSLKFIISKEKMTKIKGKILKFFVK